jgi:hypothetical protein
MIFESSAILIIDKNVNDEIQMANGFLPSGFFQRLIGRVVM